MSTANPKASAVAPAGRVDWLRRACVAATMLVGVALVVWLVFWPQLDGHYTGDAGGLTVDVVFDGKSAHVTMGGDAVLPERQKRFNAERGFTTVTFGQDILSRQSLVFHPFKSGPGQYELVSGCRSITLGKSTPGSRFALAHPYLVVLVVMAGVLYFMGWVLNEKAKGEPEAIFPMWLAYFVAFFVSVGALFWAGNSGFFGFDGVPRNLVARIIVQAAEWFLAVNDECMLLLGILATFVLPQWFAYFFAGASGAAQRSRLVVFAWKWVALFIAKAFISASAVLMGIVLVGGHYGWHDPEPLHVVANAMMAMLLLIPGLGIFCTVPLKKAKGKPISKRVWRVVRRVHTWARRNLRKPQGAVARQIEMEVREAAQRRRNVLHAVRSCKCGRGQWVWEAKQNRGASWRLRRLFHPRRER